MLIRPGCQARSFTSYRLLHPGLFVAGVRGHAPGLNFAKWVRFAISIILRFLCREPLTCTRYPPFHGGLVPEILTFSGNVNIFDQVKLLIFIYALAIPPWKLPTPGNY